MVVMRRILFICTGNVFRSLTAEYALRKCLGTNRHILVASAGTEDFPHVVHPFVRNYLLAQGLDVSSHCRRTLTPEILNEASFVIAMSTEHRYILAKHFNRPDVSLFTEACGLPSEPLPDVEEVVIDHKTNPAAVQAHVRKIIHRIIELTPQLAKRILETLR
jgi:protein-tyrosine phosphatase